MNYIVDQIGLIVAAMRSEENGEPYYIYGHRKEIANRLLIKDKDPVFKNEKYPLIALRLDTQEVIKNGLVEYDLNLVIVSLSNKTRTAEQRYEDVIKPVLIPLYERFFIELKNSGFFTWDGDLNKPPHTKIDRPYWGIPDNEGNISNIFNDPLDAIEIQGLKIRGRQYDCEVPELPDNRVTINVNSSLFAKVKPFLTFNVPVINTDGDFIGSKIGDNWVVPAAGLTEVVINFNDTPVDTATASPYDVYLVNTLGQPIGQEDGISIIIQG